MKEFLKTNTVTYNLMSFTAFRAILIFSLLASGPKTYKEIQYSLATNEYIKEAATKDSIRNYIYTLEQIGCRFTKIKEGAAVKLALDAHPLVLKITDEQAESIIKVFKTLSKSIELNDLIALQNFFRNITQYISNEDLKITLENISPLSNIDNQLLQDLLVYAKNNTEITFLYNSPRSGHKNITMVVDKLEIKNSKLYVFGNSSEHKAYSSFLVNKIIKIISINLENKTLDVPELVIGYEYLQNGNEELELLSCEKIIEKNGLKCLIEMTTRSKFEAMQRILSHTNKCKVLYPEGFRADVIDELKKMKEGYIAK